MVKKYVVFFTAVIMVAGAMMLTGCGSRHDEGLIGEWAFVDSPAVLALS